ncbi:hypothetical protein AB0958_07520 [Streptomyces sp. NPDC006655]|uniref:hypothetical protein n=1 Tax=Streptomyces sp. NPDC006655 TaxID=3156898 RepID=UPI0034550C28
MSRLELTALFPACRDGRNVVLVLPVERLCETTVRSAAAYTRDRGGTLTFALIMPWPPPMSAGAVALPYGELWFEYELRTDMDLSEILYDTDVPWTLVPVFHVSRDIPYLAGSVGAGVVLIPDSGRSGWFSPARRRARRLAVEVSRRTGAAVHSVPVPWHEGVIPKDSPV